jgi:hypothetical protein
MKNLLIILFIWVVPVVLLAQDPIKKRIGFIPYTDPDNAEEEYRELAYRNIYDAALRVFVNTQRFDVLDRGSFNVVKIEKEFQKGEDLANTEIVEQGKIAAAQLIAVAKLSTLTVTESDDGKGYSVYITAEFKQIDVETGKALNAFQLTSSITDKDQILGMDNKRRISTEEEAISRAVSKMEKDLEKWVKQTFPMILKVLEPDEKNMTIVVDGGWDVGLSDNFKMRAVKIKIFANGKKLINSIGKLEFTKEGVGESLTVLKFASKAEWQEFLKSWETENENIYVTEEI